ncbi:pirin family, partial [Rhizoctonia solani]
MLIRSLSTTPLWLPRFNVPRITAAHLRKFGSSNEGARVPWFMDEQTYPNETTATINSTQTECILPNNIPEHLIALYEHLSQSPLLGSAPRICKPSSLPSRNLNDMALAYSQPKGRRRRGVHDAGESVGEPDDMWSWYMIAQVKEGTECRGAIESVIRSAQKELLNKYPNLPIPRKLSRRRTSDGWEVLDMGDSLLHVRPPYLRRGNPHVRFLFWTPATDIYRMAEDDLILVPAERDSDNTSRRAIKTINALETPEGSGATVWRTIGGPELENLDPFLMLDHFLADHDRAAFPDHPHRGQATITYMLQGSIQHEDSMGNLGTLCTGDVQWMIAGRGVKHAEMPIYQEGTDVPIGLQLWVNLPSQHKMTAPTYRDIKSDAIPTIVREHGNIEIRIISGTSCGISVTPPSVGGCWYLHLKFRKDHFSFDQELLLAGTLSIRSETFSPRTAVVLSSNPNESYVHLSAEEDGTEIVLFAAKPLNQPIARFGPFVMNTKEELQKAILDYRMEINGFENARRWKSSIGGRQ